MRNASPSKFIIIKWCVLTTILFSLVLYLLHSIGFFHDLKKYTILKELDLPTNTRSTLIANEKYYDFLQYIDGYDWNMISFSDYTDHRDILGDAVKNNPLWHLEEVSQDALRVLISVLPGDRHGFQTLVPVLRTNFDAWYFQASATGSTKTGLPATIEDLITYCKKETIFSYEIALFDEEEGLLWSYQFN